MEYMKKGLILNGHKVVCDYSICSSRKSKNTQAFTRVHSILRLTVDSTNAYSNSVDAFIGKKQYMSSSNCQHIFGSSYLTSTIILSRFLASRATSWVHLVKLRNRIWRQIDGIDKTFPPCSLMQSAVCSSSSTPEALPDELINSLLTPINTPPTHWCWLVVKLRSHRWIL